MTLAGPADAYHGAEMDVASTGTATLSGAAPISGAGLLSNEGLIEGSGSIMVGKILNSGTISASGGAFTIGGPVTGTGVLAVASGATLTLTGAVSATGTAILAGMSSVLALQSASAGLAVLSVAGGTMTIGGGGSAILNAADTGLSVTLTAATNLTLSRMSAIAAIGSSGADTITALSSGQTLTGGLGADMLAGAAATGDVFRDHGAGLNGDTITGFAGTDTIDVTDFAPDAGLTLRYTQQGDAGKLIVSEGSASTTITLQGQFTAASFTTASDLHGGVLIGLHG